MNLFYLHRQQQQNESLLLQMICSLLLKLRKSTKTDDSNQCYATKHLDQSFMVATEKEKKTNDQGRIEPKLTHNEIKISILLANRIRRDD